MTPARRYLFTFLTADDADLNLARRRFPYDVLVLLVRPEQESRAQALAVRERAVGGASGCDVVVLAADDMYGAIESLRGALAAVAPGASSILNLAGANPAHVAASMVLAFERGMETVMCQHDHVSTLPILSGVTLRDQFEEIEHKVLARLTKQPIRLGELAQHLLIPKPRLHKACRELQQKGMAVLSTSDGESHAALNRHGVRIRQHLESGKQTAARAAPRAPEADKEGEETLKSV